jgi:hypothetical protein
LPNSSELFTPEPTHQKTVLSQDKNVRPKDSISRVGRFEKRPILDGFAYRSATST